MNCSIRIMKRLYAKFFLLFLLLTHLALAADSTIRYPFVSGEFYPSNLKELSRRIVGRILRWIFTFLPRMSLAKPW